MPSITSCGDDERAVAPPAAADGPLIGHLVHSIACLAANDSVSRARPRPDRARSSRERARRPADQRRPSVAGRTSRFVQTSAAATDAQLFNQRRSAHGVSSRSNRMIQRYVDKHCRGHPVQTQSSCFRPLAQMQTSANPRGKLLWTSLLHSGLASFGASVCPDSSRDRRGRFAGSSGPIGLGNSRSPDSL